LNEVLSRGGEDYRPGFYSGRGRGSPYAILPLVSSGLWPLELVLFAPLSFPEESGIFQYAAKGRFLLLSPFL